jgi:predicted nucleic acid-binding protein
MDKIITNATPIISLSFLGKLKLLAELFNEVYIPSAVYREVVHGKSPRKYGRIELEEVVSKDVFTLYQVENSDLIHKLYGKLHEGELEVIVGAKELNIAFVAIDEHAARTLAKTFLLQPVGTVGILLFAKKKGKLDNVKDSLDQLIENGFFISKNIYEQALYQANEHESR